MSRIGPTTRRRPSRCRLRRNIRSTWWWRASSVVSDSSTSISLSMPSSTGKYGSVSESRIRYTYCPVLEGIEHGEVRVGERVEDQVHERLLRVGRAPPGPLAQGAELRAPAVDRHHVAAVDVDVDLERAG